MKRVQLPKGPVPIPRRNINKKRFLCIEHGEKFTVEAKDLEDAKEQASIYGGEVIKELK